MKRALGIIIQPFSYGLLVLTFFLTIFPSSLAALPFKKETRTRIAGPFWKLFSHIVLHFVTLSKVYKRDERPLEIQKKCPPEGLYIANHQSFVDVPLIITCFQIPPIMKKEVLYIPLFGLCGYAAGAMIVDRSKRNSRKRVFEQATERLSQGIKALHFFPEGTRQKEADSPKEYNEIKKPLLKFAYEQNIPVYSVSVYGTKKVLNPKTGLINHGQKLGIIIKDAQLPQNFANAEEFMKTCWDQVRAGYFELQEKLT